MIEVFVSWVKQEMLQHLSAKWGAHIGCRVACYGEVSHFEIQGIWHLTGLQLI
jgi:hypothetical protein